MNDPAAANVLTPRENGELVALLRLVEKGRIKVNGDDWRRYLALFEAQQSGSRAPLDTVPAEAPEPFELDPVPGPNGLSEIALLYADTVDDAILRRLKRWRKDGRDAGKPPPVEDPAAMPRWWEEMRAAGQYSRPCPEILIRAAARLAEKKSSPPAKGIDPPPAEPAPVRHYDITPEEKDPRQLLARLEQEEARLHRRYLDAVGEGETDFDLDQHRKRWTEISNLLQLQRTRAEKSKSLLTPGEVDAAFLRVVRPLPEALQRAFPVEPPPAESWAETVREAIRTAFARLPATLEEMLAA